MRSILVMVLITLAACAPRGELSFAAQALSPSRPIFVGTSRATDPQTGVAMSNERLEAVRFARYDVAVPPEREPGDISFTRKGRAPDPAIDFITTAHYDYVSAAAFQGDLRRSLRAHGGEAVVFVHGYNNTFAEGLYRFAQIGHDMQLPGTLVHYAWPSRGAALGYAYDRDSALFARDGFEDLLEQVAAAGARRIVIVGHSMGGALTMETLRQMAISGNRRLAGKIGGVVLISPDLDVDVFRAQARRIGRMPQPFIIFTSQRDRALALAARLSGEPERLGNLQDISRVADLKVTMVEVGAYSEGAGHFTPASSPLLIALLGKTGQVASVLEGDQIGRTGLLPGVVLTVQQATRIVLAPVDELTGGALN